MRKPALRLRINETIRSPELRVIDNEGNNLGVITREQALEEAKKRGLDLIEISASATPPIAKITEYGKYKYQEEKKQRKSRQHTTETKIIQVKVGTGEHDLALKAKKGSLWLKDGHRLQIELFLAGRSKYMEESFLKERINRILTLISEPYKVVDAIKRGPKGLVMTIERESVKKIPGAPLPKEEKPQQ